MRCHLRFCFFMGVCSRTLACGEGLRNLEVTLSISCNDRSFKWETYSIKVDLHNGECSKTKYKCIFLSYASKCSTKWRVENSTLLMFWGTIFISKTFDHDRNMKNLLNIKLLLGFKHCRLLKLKTCYVRPSILCLRWCVGGKNLKSLVLFLFLGTLNNLDQLEQSRL